ncbi:N-acyl homoserine lactonase family protein [Aspergillus alliaceus]|uniref:N-acyl homoserine lactonase family protein n=1 Tax=Petromyces alliaceus TaxID=209559 RepID=UPI0012A3F8CA|nr:beta-lactamase-like protein [Aspergillus alliaceus]KAB8226994.1 beta-lactamase-like protein [Aspergillus alliaceus]
MNSRQLAKASIPAYTCPEGTKMHILDLGTLSCDEGWIFTAGNTGTFSEPQPTRKWRDLMLLSGLIDHPEMGLILFETGCAEDIELKWTPASADVFPRTRYEPQHRLPAAIKAAGYDIKDVKAVVMGHLHLDHAGGLEHFLNTRVPIYVHEEEFKYACWGAGTKIEGGSYLPDYLPLDGSLNWQTFNDSQLDLCTGITLHLCAGHTPGLCIMQVNLPQDGTFIWTTDQFHVRENYEKNHAQGWLLRDHKSWMDSTNFIRRLQKQYSATIIFGHDAEVGTALIQQKKFFQ